MSERSERIEAAARALLEQVDDGGQHHAHQEIADLRAALEAAQPEQGGGEAVAWGDINARLRQHVEGIKDHGCAHYNEPFSCDKQPNGTRSLRPCEPCWMARLLDRAAFDAFLGAPAHPTPAATGEGDAALVKAVDGLLHTIASSVPRDAPFSFMLTRDVAEVSRALAAHRAARPA